MAVHWTLSLCLSTFSIKSVPKRSILSIRQPAEKELLDKLAKTDEPLSRKRPLSSISLIQLSTVKGIGVGDGVEPKFSDYFCSNICCGPSYEDSKMGSHLPILPRCRFMRVGAMLLDREQKLEKSKKLATNSPKNLKKKRKFQKSVC